jgi:hypothetical protein
MFSTLLLSSFHSNSSFGSHGDGGSGADLPGTNMQPPAAGFDEYFRTLLATSSNYLTIKRRLIQKFGQSTFEAKKAKVSKTLSDLSKSTPPSPPPCISKTHATLIRGRERGEENQPPYPAGIKSPNATRDRSALILAKAAVAKLRYDSDAFRVYIRNRDRTLARALRGLQLPAGFEPTVAALCGVLTNT